MAPARLGSLYGVGTASSIDWRVTHTQRKNIDIEPGGALRDGEGRGATGVGAPGAGGAAARQAVTQHPQVVALPRATGSEGYLLARTVAPDPCQ